MKPFSFLGKKGFTLVETVISIAILAIMATMITGIFSAAASKTAENIRANKQKELLLTQIETAIASGEISSELSQTEGNLVIDFGGRRINVSGVYLSGSYGDGKLPVKYFYVQNQGRP